MPVAKYSRVLLKLSGEALGGGSYGIDPRVVAHIAAEIEEVMELGVEVAVVVGGGNIWRGALRAAPGGVWIGLQPIIWVCWPPF